MRKKISLIISIFLAISSCNAQTYSDKSLQCPNIENNFSLEIKDKIASPKVFTDVDISTCLLYTSPSPRDQRGSRMPSSA